MLDRTLRDIERVLYFEAYMVTDPALTSMSAGQVLSEEEYYTLTEEEGEEFTALMGAEAIKAYMKDMDLDAEIVQLRE